MSKRSPHKIRKVLTDWSGVISDDRYPVYEANIRMLERRNFPRISFDEWLPTTTASPREYFVARGVIENEDALFNEYTELYSEVRSGGMHPFAYPDAKLFLNTLKQKSVPVLVVSSHPEQNLKKEAEEYGLSPLIEKFIGSAKDKSVELKKIVGNYSPREFVYLGDTIYDIQSAKKAGVVSVGVASGYHVREKLEAQKPDILVDSLTELLQILLTFEFVG